MSALGDYVHYNKTNYIYWGTKERRKGKKGSSLEFKSAKEIVDKKINNIDNVKASTIDILKNRIKDNSKENINKDNNEDVKRKQEIINIIYEMLEEAGSSQSINSFIYGGSSEKTKAKYYLSNEKIKGLSKTEIEEKQKALNNIENNLILLKDSSFTSQEFNEIAEKVIKDYNLIYNKNLRSTSRLKNKSAIGTIMDDINNYNILSSASAVAGTFGEYLVASAADTCQNLAKEELKKAMRSSIRGNEFSLIELNKNNIASFYQADENNNIFSIKASKDKVDVSIALNNENINANIKTYKSGNDLHMQDVSLLYSLVALNKNDFSNHWLNMASLKINDNNKKIADDIIEKELLYEAFSSGNPLKNNTKKANIFVYINRTNGEIEILNIKDLILNYKNINRIIVKPFVEDLIISHKWNSTSAYERINNMINEIHQMKVSVKYKWH